MTKTLLCVSTLTLLLSGCALLLGEGEGAEEAEIVFGESIEGITIGDDSSEVVQQIGEPVEVASNELPVLTYRYGEASTEPLDGLEVEIGTGRIAVEGVVGVCAYAPYDGQTEEGVGIGTSRREVLERLGEPDFPLPWGTIAAEVEPEGRYDYYDFAESRFRLEYRAEYRSGNALYSICMEPPAEEPNRVQVLINAAGTVRELDHQPYHVIEPDYSKGSLGLGVGAVPPSQGGLPEEFRRDGLRVVFSGEHGEMPPGVRVTAIPFKLYSIEALE